jgi:WhiB family redox-sensing transcriptional regulator
MTWRLDASCRSVDPEVFFPSERSQTPEYDLAVASSVCGKCPVAEQCADLAQRLKVTHGVWGGRTADQLRRMSVTSSRRQCA